jgi:hypothetical protein
MNQRNRATAIGFVFGWAYPLLRGRTGLTKAILLATVIAVPLFVIRIFPRPATRSVFVTTVQTAAELVADARASSACLPTTRCSDARVSDPAS